MFWGHHEENGEERCLNFERSMSQSKEVMEDGEESHLSQS